jgi:hypothetical protein
MANSIKIEKKTDRGSWITFSGARFSNESQTDRWSLRHALEHAAEESRVGQARAIDTSTGSVIDYEYA